MMTTVDWEQITTAIGDYDPDNLPSAYQLLGYSEDQYKQLRELVGLNSGISSIFRRLGIDNYCSRKTPNGQLILEYPETILCTWRRSAMANKVLDLIEPIVADQGSLMIAFSANADSPYYQRWAELLAEQQCLLLLLDPQGRVRTVAPGDDWQEIPGGWKKGTMIVSAQPLFITDDKKCHDWRQRGDKRFTAANQSKVNDVLNRLLAGRWPQLSSEQQDAREAREQQWRQIIELQEIIDQYCEFHYQHECNLSDLRETVIEIDSDLEYKRQDIIELERELSSARQRQQELIIELQQAEKKRDQANQYQHIDRRQQLLNSLRGQEAAREISSWPEVIQAEIDDHFSLYTASGPALTLTLQFSADQHYQVNISADGVTVNGQSNDFLQSRDLALAQYLATGQWQKAAQIIVAAGQHGYLDS